MSDKQKKRKLTYSEARILSEQATHTRFTWAVIFLACITALIGLLPQIPLMDESTSALMLLLSILYVVLDGGLALCLYKILFTTYLLEMWSRQLEPRIVKELKEKWKTTLPLRICVTEKNGELRFMKYYVYAYCIFLIVFFIAILILKTGMLWFPSDC